MVHSGNTLEKKYEICPTHINSEMKGGGNVFQLIYWDWHNLMPEPDTHMLKNKLKVVGLYFVNIEIKIEISRSLN